MKPFVTIQMDSQHPREMTRAVFRCCEAEECRSDPPTRPNCVWRAASQIKQTAFVVLCAAILPAVLCVSVSAGDLSRHKSSQVETDCLRSNVPRLRKSLSHIRCLDQAKKSCTVCEDETDSSIYSPTHSSRDLQVPRELHSRGLRGGSSRNSTVVRAHFLVEDEQSPNVYTRLQTQLYPEMRF